MCLSSEKDLLEEKNEDIENEKVIDDNVTYDVKYLEDNGVDVNSAIELLGDMEMFNSTMKDYVNSVQDKWNLILKYKNNSDMENYAIQVHSLKSDSKYLGLIDLANVAYNHELKSKENDVLYVNEHFAELEDQYNKTLEIVKKYNSNK